MGLASTLEKIVARLTSMPAAILVEAQNKACGFTEPSAAWEIQCCSQSPRRSKLHVGGLQSLTSKSEGKEQFDMCTATLCQGGGGERWRERERESERRERERESE